MPGERWSEQEKKQLRTQIQAKGPGVEQVHIRSRTPAAIRSQAVRSGLVAQGAPKAKWSAQQKRLLKRFHREGLTPMEIHRFELLGEPQRSLWAIRKQWGRLKLSDRGRARRMRNKKNWKAGEKQAFDRYLRQHSSAMTPEQIGKSWGVGRSTVARRQTELGLKVSRERVLQMDYSLAKQRRLRRRLRQRNLRRWAALRSERETELLELAEKLRLRAAEVAEQKCSDCGRSWPRRREFFHTRDKKISIGASRYYKRRCRLCENARRRAVDRRRRKPRGQNGRA